LEDGVVNLDIDEPRVGNGADGVGIDFGAQASADIAKDFCCATRDCGIAVGIQGLSFRFDGGGKRDGSDASEKPTMIVWLLASLAWMKFGGRRSLPSSWRMACAEVRQGKSESSRIVVSGVERMGRPRGTAVVRG
jgi:hypothetical protein